VKAVILQPSYIPWRGHFDQICRADLFVFYDDVQYDTRGWRNRNQIKTAQGKQWLTIPVHGKGAQEGIPIKEIRIDWTRPWARKHLQAMTHAYSRAPHFKSYLPWLEETYSRHDEFLADFTVRTTMEIASLLGIADTRFMRASEIEGIDGRGTDRLIQILQRVGAGRYITGPSATDYIEREKFDRAGIALEFIEYDYAEYPQLHPPYDPFVTILDLLFMTGRDASAHITGCDERR